VVPAGVVTTHTVFCLKGRLDVERQHFLCAMFNSYVLNALVRMLMGGHVTTTLVASLPVPLWQGDRIDRQIARSARRLAAPGTQNDRAPRLQGAVARRFGVSRSEFEQVLDGFPLVAIDERTAALRWFDAWSSRMGRPRFRR
jgi:hypothetical protein